MARETSLAPRDLKGRTKAFALRIVRLYSSLPKSTVAQTLGKQVLWSGTSVGANWREENRSRLDAESVAKVEDCLKELDETAYWLELLVEAGVVSESKLSSLRDECDQLLAILTAIALKAKRSAR